MEYDEAMLRLRRLGGDELVAKIVELFVRQTPERVTGMRDGLVAGNLETVERTAHSLRSSAGNVGAVALAELAARVEQQARERRAERLDELLDELELEFRAADSALRVQSGVPA